jgi:hypothetical protein
LAEYKKPTSAIKTHLPKELNNESNKKQSHNFKT